MSQSSRVTIVGTGLLGASLALALKRRGEGEVGEVIGVGRSRQTLDAAMATGGFDAVSTDLASVLPGTSLVVLATPLSGFEAALETIGGWARDMQDAGPTPQGESAGVGLIVTDVGSTKSPPLEAARRWLPAGVRFVGSHPMAGSERRGPEAADAGLFRGRPCIVCREPETDAAAFEAVAGMWRSLGMKVLTMPAEEHDRQTAATSHLPHAAAVMLVHAAEELGGWDVASTGFRDTTRLASSNPPMRRDIMRGNRRALLDALGELRRQIEAVESHIEAADAGDLLDYLDGARERREAWLKSYESERDG